MRKYYKTDRGSLEKCREDLEKKSVIRSKTESLELETRITETPKYCRCYKGGRRKKPEDGEELPWINDDIRSEIKEKKRLNKSRRNAQCKEEVRWKELYTVQKVEVQTQIRKEISKHEEKITKRN